jgi:ParB family chromosome partitioning protein
VAKEIKLNLPSADSLFTTQEERDDAKLERVMDLPLSEISDFPDHPFKVRMDAEMQEMAESVKQYGVLVPGLVRPKDGSGYEMVAGHRRKTASKLAQRETMPCIIRNLTDDEATIIMVDSNLQREKILPSEKAFAYKMKLDAMKRQAGRPSKDNSAPVGQDFEGKTSRELLAEKSPDSHSQIQRYIRLTELIPELLEMVDNAALGEKPQVSIAMRPAVELSYLPKEQQQFVLSAIQSEICTPSHDQTLRMREKSKEGLLDEDAVLSIMQEEKPNQAEQFKLPKEKLSKFFAPGTPAQKIEDTIIKALELYRQRERNRDARQRTSREDSVLLPRRYGLPHFPSPRPSPPKTS